MEEYDVVVGWYLGVMEKPGAVVGVGFGSDSGGSWSRFRGEGCPSVITGGPSAAENSQSGCSEPRTKREAPEGIRGAYDDDGVRRPGYVVLNRPWAFVQWLETATIEEEYIFMAEPDHIFLGPVPNLVHE
ncbi:Hydroxyproline O-arabinosyltransferase NOD3 [Sesamum alatum]|uniref:Hydroxyproline O-arabinosyltransferase NOD3 n=1 Tax=Sesamum alatum TaxID=300844 RepID=A0AAE1Y1Q3_9LAMI|nr:Hydroxyproline O-arabinosyltransferase NOD3 [Sesamum alatum]